MQVIVIRKSVMYSPDRLSAMLIVGMGLQSLESFLFSVDNKSLSS